MSLCVGAKANVLQLCCFVCGVAALLILLKCWFLCSFYVCRFIGCTVVNRMTANVLQLQEVGDFEAQNSLPSLNLIRSTNVQLTTEPPISCRCCYRAFFFSVSCQLLLSFFKFSCQYNYCHNWSIK
jgi:hypothetical protein